MPESFVAILLGSDSDLATMQATFEVLKDLGVRFEVKLTSAHRTPEATHSFVKDAEGRGCGAFICAAGLAAHLAGTVAAITVRPVIGVPMEGGPLQGMDALLSTVQMPGGIPVATVAIGDAGAKNAAYLAAQVLAISDTALSERLRIERRRNAETIQARDAALRKELGL